MTAATQALLAEAERVQSDLETDLLGERLAVIDQLAEALKLSEAAYAQAESDRLYWRRRFHSARNRAMAAEAQIT